MSYKIRIPSTNPDTIGRFAVTPGTPDAIITFPNESGEVATTSDIPQGGSTTTYVLQNTYSDEGTDLPQPVTEWDIPVVAGKLYKFEYCLVGKSNGSFNTFTMIYQTSSFSNPLIFGLGSYGGPSIYQTDLSDPNWGMYPASIGGSEKGFSFQSGYFKATETGTLRHLFQNPTDPDARAGASSSYTPYESFLQVTPLN